MVRNDPVAVGFQVNLVHLELASDRVPGVRQPRQVAHLPDFIRAAVNRYDEIGVMAGHAGLE